MIDLWQLRGLIDGWIHLPRVYAYLSQPGNILRIDRDRITASRLNPCRKCVGKKALVLLVKRESFLMHARIISCSCRRDFVFDLDEAAAWDLQRAIR